MKSIGPVPCRHQDLCFLWTGIRLHHDRQHQHQEHQNYNPSAAERPQHHYRSGDEQTQSRARTNVERAIKKAKCYNGSATRNSAHKTATLWFFSFLTSSISSILVLWWKTLTHNISKVLQQLVVVHLNPCLLPKLHPHQFAYWHECQQQMLSLWHQTLLSVSISVSIFMPNGIDFSIAFYTICHLT